MLITHINHLDGIIALPWLLKKCDIILDPHFLWIDCIQIAEDFEVEKIVKKAYLIQFNFLIIE